HGSGLCSIRVGEQNRVSGAAVTILDAKLPPLDRHAWVDHQRVTLFAEAEYRLESDAVHPARGPRIPGPSATAEVSGRGVDVGRHHIRLHLVGLDLLPGARVRQGVNHLKELERPIAISPERGGEHHPERRMGVLGAVLPDTGEVALDVTGVERGHVEWRG